MFNIITKRFNIYKKINDIQERLKDKMGTPQEFIMFRDVKGTESGKVYADTFYMDISNKEILDAIDNQDIKYQIDSNKQVYNYVFNIKDKDKVKEIINNYNLKHYDSKGYIEDAEVIDNSYLEKYLYQYNKS